MHALRAGLLDRLLGEHAHSAFLTVEQFKDMLARDLEELLNTRTALAPEALHGFPECARSVFNFGLPDFAGLSPRSSEERTRICADVRLAIERHEPRLRHVQVNLRPSADAVNRIDIAIVGVLQVPGMQESVNFSAMLRPSSLHYAIRRGANP